jgi:hypothetical protein
MLDGIARNIQSTPDDDHDDIWQTIYKRARRNLVNDVSKQIQAKFHTNLKLVTRETSEYKATPNSATSRAGVTIEYDLPKYARVHIISIGVFSETSYSSGGVFRIYDTDENGELLATITAAITSGRNTINVDQDFEADKLFISYDPTSYMFRETENKYFADHLYTSYGPVICDEQFYGDPDFSSLAVQINGGGLNVKFLIYCSMEKYVCENIKFFEDAFLYKIGHEITVERRLGERLNEFTVMSQERWTELEAFYKAQYETNLMNVINGSNIPEDEFCFACRNTVRTDTILP